VAAALAIKAPALFGFELDQNGGFYARNLSLFVLPFLTGYFALRAGLCPWQLRGRRAREAPQPEKEQHNRREQH
jgi:hypothetical protein